MNTNRADLKLDCFLPQFSLSYKTKKFNDVAEATGIEN